jgi:hypothetical protein
MSTPAPAPAAEPVYTTTTNGVALDSSMTPQQRFDAIAKSMGAEVAKPDGRAGMGPPLHYHPAEAGPAPVAKAPAPAVAPAASKPTAQGAPSADRLAQFDAEMQEQGIQKRPDGRVLAAGEIDQEAIQALGANYTALVKHLQGKTDEHSVASAARFKQAYENDLQALYNGRQLTQQQLDKLRGKTGNVETMLPKAPKAEPPAPQPPAGFVPVAQVDTAGYRLPADVTHLAPDTGKYFAAAKAAGFTQGEIDEVLKGMK